MRIYTRTGDKGSTSVIGGRVSKDDVRVEAYGTIDELNAFVGQAAAAVSSLERDSSADWEELAEELAVIQQELFDCGSDLSYANPEPAKLKVTAEMAERLEAWIDRHEAALPPIERFILPGGSEIAALLHVCRTVCRRAERRIVTLAASSQPYPEETLRYINRLSDYFFTAARRANVLLGVPDVEYERGARVFGENRRSQPE
ncbi:cob(I)yrinic acid a,c-diamide adenosyltransferase [Cohnella lubricantis]|uniref:Corrinoid adenosyltransferase n=1 Tax=Cohnella lubricantis TaxID=2163172 RepID=A0A841TA16_9BACL|nr:cob(I)yrinic acid a,c-diamide adenosyltransferase [Cohnella lubricantis]MBB6678343.1 cob(I)yrinic acid a,c-diamide adenosyltransferase [Cohnella lubricantis]MBP2116723.1 cob(I)alamin adenosyltransferase [Cohnella lubricantis]